MCFEFGSCFGNGRSEDVGGEPSDRKPLPHGRGGRGRRGSRGNDEYYGGATDHKAATYGHQPPTAVDEAGHKAYHDGAGKAHHGVPGAHGYRKPADETAVKVPAPSWQNKVGEDHAGYTYTYTARLSAGPRENAAVDYQQYPAATTNATLIKVLGKAAAGAQGYHAYEYPKSAQKTGVKDLSSAWQNKVGDHTGYTYTARLAAGRREDAAVDYQHYPAATTNATLVSNYSTS